MLGINRSMAQMGLRSLLGTGSDAALVISAQRLASDASIWLTMLNEKRLKALDMLPVSVFRVQYKTMDVPLMDLNDDEFKRGIYINSMMMEACNFVFRNHLHPTLAIGMEPEGFNKFANSDFHSRQTYVARGGFSFGTNTLLRRLELNPNCKDSLLRDVNRILISDAKRVLKTDSKPFEMLKDFDRQAMSLSDIAEAMVSAGIQTVLTHAHTGLERDEVEKLKRKQRRSTDNLSLLARAGRITSPATLLRDKTLHATLFCLSYVLIAEGWRRNTNAQALIVAYGHYRKIIEHLGFRRTESLCINSCFRLATGLKSTEIWFEQCSDCSEYMLQSQEAELCSHCKQPTQKKRFIVLP